MNPTDCGSNQWNCHRSIWVPWNRSTVPHTNMEIIMSYASLASYDVVTDQEKDRLTLKEQGELRNKRIHEYIDMVQRGDDEEFALEEIIKNYIGMIRSIAKRFCGQLSPDELMADGIIAVQNAIQVFDKNRGVLFTTYAYKSASIGIMFSDYLFDSVTDYPEYIKHKIKRVAEAKLKCLQEFYVEFPTPEQIFSLIDDDTITLEDVKMMENNAYVQDPVRIDNPDSVDLDTDERFAYTDTRFDEIDIKIDIINSLDDDERKILCHSFGILDHEKLSAKEIIQRLDKPMTVVSLSRKKKEIISKIRKIFADS